jgi:hypothetical protein
LETKTTLLRYINMLILKDYTYSQNFKFMPRSEKVALMVFTDELTNIEHTIENPTLVKDRYYLQLEIDETFDFLVDGHTYRLDCYDSEGVPLYRDKIMCTNQEIKDYTINNGDYVANHTSNDFVIYE